MPHFILGFRSKTVLDFRSKHVELILDWLYELVSLTN